MAVPALAFVGFVLATAAIFLVPALIIQPFKHQSERGLMLAMAVRQQGPWLTLVTAIAAVVMAFLLWPRIKVWARCLIVLGLCLTFGAGAMARIDYFEWMFHPVPAAGFESAASSKLDSSEMVMAVRVGADSRAYPIREMSYHHILNDVAGGVPIAVTY